jgi:hypothetical protein
VRFGRQKGGNPGPRFRKPEEDWPSTMAVSTYQWRFMMDSQKLEKRRGTFESLVTLNKHARCQKCRRGVARIELAHRR